MTEFTKPTSSPQAEDATVKVTNRMYAVFVRGWFGVDAR